ncbi:AsmA family protein [Devosia sp. SL43]|uniref:AsmA family protein n=1 Tax=Devosia sp. SL43 TaxID=2806348 RepID=UPI001F2FCF8C|nr:AsmA family protein [Devosia sp. SL43]UJW86726.1 AsmA family protein [Devosia sp. SL43]
MLNRIYIIVGMLAIIVLAGAFLAPRFVHWGDYRGRMEQLATGVLGTPVTIRGEIEFSLLPQPRLSFTDVLVGSPEEPAATVDSVEAEFSLMDFLRDNYNVTRLVLRGPVVDFDIDESGFFGSGVALSGSGGGVVLSETSIVDATIRLLDRRGGDSFVADDVDGELKLTSFAGPFQFQGTGNYNGERYSVRFNSAAVTEAGSTQVSGFLALLNGGFSLSTEGQLTPGMAPKYDGVLTYRQRPPETAVADEIRGDLVFESKVTGSTDRIVLSGYVLQPDENRASTRLTGAASIQLGARQSFDAVISGGVFALPPRDAKENASTMPYEAVRLLSELPAPMLPPIPGRIGVDLAEIGLRGFALREVRVDASTDGSEWTIEQFIGRLPGDTEVRAGGTLTAEDGRPAFRGDVTISSARLDGLSALWRKPADDTPLFNQPGALAGRVMLVGDALGLSNGLLTLAGAANSVEMRLGFGGEKRLDVVGHFGQLGANGSALLAALLPNLANDPGFGLSFPGGSFSLTGQTARMFGYDGSDLVAEGQWATNKVTFSRLSAGEWGGIGFDLAASAGGTVAQPDMSGSGMVRIASADAPALAGFYDLLGTPQAWRDFLALSAPAELLVDLQPPGEGGLQVLTLGGALGAGDLDLRAELGGGIAALSTGQLQLTATLESTDTVALTQQIGFGTADLFDGESMLVSIGLTGSPSNSLNSRLTASSGDETMSFAGELLSIEDGEIQGNGALQVALADAGGLAHIVGAQGLSLPQVQGSAHLHFEGDRLATLTEIAGTSGETGFTGELSLARSGATAAVDGAIAVDAVSVEGLASTLFGRAALVGGAGIWPEGPISVGDQQRTTRGSVSVTSGSVMAGGEERLGATSFELTWDETRLRLSRFEAALGAGKINLDIAVCCAGPLVDKTASGRVSLTGAPLDAIAPPAVATALDGVLEGGVSFEATGASVGDLLAVLAGEGNFTLADFSVVQLAPGVFPTVAGLDDVLNMEPDALAAIIGLSLGQGPFAAPSATGAFTIAGGVARLTNFIVEGEGARLAGDINLALPLLGLNGSFVLTPLGFEDANGLVGVDTARITNRIAGTLLAPETVLDLEEMVASIQVRANELEVDRLEILRAEDEARQRAAAEERNRLIEEQRRKAAEEAARLAAEEAARIAAEEEAQRQLLLQQQQQSPSIQTLPNQPATGPLNLGLPPPQVNQPIGNGVNQPFTPVN